MAKNLFFVFILLCSSVAYAQELQSELQDQDWRIIPGSYEKNKPGWDVYVYPVFKHSDGDFNMSRVMLSPTEAVVLVSFDGRDYGALKINDKMKVGWKLPLKGVPYAIFKFRKNLLVCTESDISKIGRKRESGIYLIDPQTGKIVKQQDHLDPMVKDGESDFEVRLLQNETQHEVKLGIRYYEKKLPAITRGMNIVTLDDDLKAVSNEKIPLSNNGIYLNSALNSRGDFVFLSAEENNQLKVQTFEAKTWIPQKRILIPFHPRKKSKFFGELYLSSFNPDYAFVYVDYLNDEKEEIRAIHKIDFSTETFFSYERALGKDFIRNIKSGYETVNKKLDKPDFDDWDKMKVIRIIDNEERVIVFEEVRYSYQSPQVNSDRIYWTTGDGLINFLNSSMKPLTYAVIPKRFRLNGPVGLSSSLHVKDNKIVMVSGYDKGKGRTAIYAQIDASSGNVEKIEELKKDEIKDNYPVDPQATLWFDDSFILSYLDADGAMLRIKKIQANLQKFSY